MSLELKFRKYLELCTQLPLLECPLESSVFLLQGCECFFRFALEKGSPYWWYNLYIEVKSGHSKWEPCDVFVEAGFKNEENFSLGKRTKTLSKCGAKEIWTMAFDDLKPKLPSDYLDGNWIKFRVYFKNLDEHHLKTRKEMDEKSVQKQPCKDTSFLMESFSQELSKLLDEGPSYDVEFKCGDQTIKAHKNILCCHSIVFASMLQSDFVEGKTGRVNIEDVDATIFQQFLRCLYTSKLPELTVENAVLLYEVADKYSTFAMKKQCAYFLADNLCAENVCDILILADRRNDEDLKKDVMEYIIKEKIPYMGQKWVDFCKENSVLANEVYYLFCQRLRQE